MLALLALAPIVIAIGLLVCRLTAPTSAMASALAAAVIAFIWFPTDGDVVLDAGTSYFPLIVEVALILLFGMCLARLLEASGAMTAIAHWVEAVSPNRSLGVAFVVFGLVPFAESVTGFGIGVTVGVPILRHLGLPTRHAALLGLLGLIAVPWGALGPGTKVAAALAGLDVDELGSATGLFNAIPTLIVIAAAILLMRPKLGSALGIVGAGVLLWAGILQANTLIGTAPAGIIGAAIVILTLGTIFAVINRRTDLTAELGRSVLPYGVLTVGLLAARGPAALWPSPVTAVIESPPFWLFVACLAAARAVVGRGRVVRIATRSWLPIGGATVAFMVLGWIMTTTGMSDALGEALPADLLFLTPLLTVVGAVLTGSNTGSNSMFSGTLDAVAASAHTSTLMVLAAGNSAGSLAALAAPPRVALAVQLTADGSEHSEGVDSFHRVTSWVQLRALLIVTVNALFLGAALQFRT